METYTTQNGFSFQSRNVSSSILIYFDFLIDRKEEIQNNVEQVDIRHVYRFINFVPAAESFQERVSTEIVNQ